MKESEADFRQPLIKSGSKDKRPLVLFLLGCCILSLPFLALQKGMPPPRYQVVKESGADRWQVISLTGKVIQPSAPPKEIHPLHQQADLSSLPYDKDKEYVFPAELALFFNLPLPLNTCRQADLEMLPGIGPRLAAMIMVERHKKGRLTGPDDLLSISGIGPGNLQRILPLVNFE